MLDACEAEDWQALAGLDIECLNTVKDIIADDPRVMFDELREMLGFYANLIEKCNQSRNGFATEALQLRQARKTANAYSNLSSVSVAAR